jgi:hypothetical protein
MSLLKGVALHLQRSDGLEETKKQYEIRSLSGFPKSAQAVSGELWCSCQTRIRRKAILEEATNCFEDARRRMGDYTEASCVPLTTARSMDSVFIFEAASVLPDHAYFLGGDSTSPKSFTRIREHAPMNRSNTRLGRGV